MKKLTSSDLALWAALPMAHTSKIERRLTMILDSTRRRTLPHHTLAFGLAMGAAALVPLAMLRPDAKAQAAPAAGMVQLVGVVNAVIPNESEWNVDGKALPAPVFDNYWGPNAKITTLPGQKALFFVFHLSKSLQQDSVIYDVSGTTHGGLSMTRMGSSPHHQMTLTTMTMQSIQLQISGSEAVYGAVFPAALARTDIQVGAASGPWTETVDCPKTAGKVHLSRPTGDVLFTLIPPHGPTSVEEVYGSRGQTPPKSASGNAVLIVSDHFHSPSPLKVDKIATMISSYASRTRSGDAVQRILHDGENEERAVYGVDKSGRIIAKLAGTYNPSLEEEAGDRFKMEQLISIPKPLLKRIASFRLVARPYQWTQFKNVALQPVKEPRN